jgi:hypothetical protein
MYAQAGVRRFIWEKVYGLQVHRVLSGQLYFELYPDTRLLPNLQTVSTSCFYHNLTGRHLRLVRNHLTDSIKQIYQEAEIIIVVGKKYRSVGFHYDEVIQRMRYVFYFPKIPKGLPVIFESIEVDLSADHYMNYRAGTECRIGTSIEEKVVFDALCGYARSLY